ncbi:MAG: glycosyltransferase family 2 protein [Thermoanaerobaculales bacterium]|jgi:glycosyltransferase involved in cell wall biosynthesis|nr:glycosyltransferase family 2 protein [Thermoanaerobaculales bacterium]
MHVSTIEISVVVPVFNEVDNIGPLVERVRSTMKELGRPWQLVLVDDGSTDGSSEEMDAAAASDPHVTVLHFVENCGQSAALSAGFAATDSELVALLDADLQTFPEDLPGLVEILEREGIDAVVGVRAERRDTLWKRFSSIVANGVRNWLTREDIQDTGCPIKIFRGEAIRRIEPFDGMHRFLPTLLKMRGCSVLQVPVRHTRRAAGVSKYGTLDRAWRGLRDALGVRWMQDRAVRWRIK